MIEKPDSFRYIIIGGGMTAAAALKGIRAVDQEGSIGIFSAEKNPPYNRPPLTKGLWQGKSIDRIWRPVEAYNAAMFLNTRVGRLNLAEKTIQTTDGSLYGYEKLLLATGGDVNRLPFGDGLIHYYRTLDDYHDIRALTAQGSSFALIGGGFICSELAASLHSLGCQVSMVFPENGINARVMPVDVSAHITDEYRRRGVQIFTGESVESVTGQPGDISLKLSSGRTLQAATVIAGVGIRPATALAAEAGLEVDNGIVVNDMCQTSEPDVYAAGDVASFHNPQLDKRLRVEHEDNANSMGEIAGRNMAGESAPYRHLPFFYSDMFDYGYEAVGELDGSMETFADWQEPFQKGVIYYLKDQRVRGVLLWNVWKQLDAARKVISQPGPFGPRTLRGLIK